MTSKKEKLVKVCPKCGSTNVCSGYFIAPNGNIKDYCGDCGFNQIDNFFTEFPKMGESKVKDFQKKLKSVNKK